MGLSLWLFLVGSQSVRAMHREGSAWKLAVVFTTISIQVADQTTLQNTSGRLFLETSGVKLNPTLFWIF
jgi:hypothetical protein